MIRSEHNSSLQLSIQPTLTPSSEVAAQRMPVSVPGKSPCLYAPVRQVWLPLYSGYVKTAKGTDGKEAAQLPTLAV